MMRRNMLRGAGAIVCAAAAASCVAPPVAGVTPSVDSQEHWTVFETGKRKVDVLFLVDNSNSMEAMASELRNRFDQFFVVFQELAAKQVYVDLHLGVVTSDYGAGKTGVGTFCDPSPGGQRGHLQALGRDAPTGCLPPTGGMPFVAYDFADGGASSNLPAGQDLVHTFTCMASVGSSGCGFEHQLESVYAALHNTVENAGFLRDDAILAVVFVTNEDDGSAPPDSDVWDASAVATWGYESTYRQTRWGVECGGQLAPYGDSGGPLADCVPATNPPGQEFDVARYVDYFTQPATSGGVKADPDDVVLFGIDAPSSPFRVMLADPQVTGGAPYQPCATLDEDPQHPCVPVLAHSCQDATQPAFFGDPAVRLNTVIDAAAHHGITSICDTDYSTALAELATLIGDRVTTECVPDPLYDPSHPDCVVEQMVAGQPAVEIPQCDASGAVPCWRIQVDASCAKSPQSLGIVIDRGGAPPPDGASVSVSCRSAS